MSYAIVSAETRPFAATLLCSFKELRMNISEGRLREETHGPVQPALLGSKEQFLSYLHLVMLQRLNSWFSSGQRDL